MPILNKTDRLVGQRLQQRRRALGISQKALGQRVRLSWQQIRKYEEGQNRIGAGRLYDFAVILRVPIRYFFEGTDHASADMDRHPEIVGIQELIAFAESKDGQALWTALQRIKDRTLRRDLIRLIQALSE